MPQFNVPAPLEEYSLSEPYTFILVYGNQVKPVRKHLPVPGGNDSRIPRGKEFPLVVPAGTRFGVTSYQYLGSLRLVGILIQQSDLSWLKNKRLWVSLHDFNQLVYADKKPTVVGDAYDPYDNG
jgi:hypothetical protein